MGEKSKQLLEEMAKQDIESRRSSAKSHLNNINSLINKREDAIEKLQGKISELQELKGKVLEAFEADDAKALQKLGDKAWELWRDDKD